MTNQLPIFPLNVVLFPGGVQPLQVFEPRYLDMVSRCLREQEGFIITLLKDGSETEADPDVYLTGVKCDIVDWGQGDNGLLNITVKAACKAKIHHKKMQADHLLLGEVELIAVEAEREIPPEFQSLSEMLARILKELNLPYYPELKLNDAAWVAGRLIELLPLNLDHKQQLFELNDPLSRLFMLRDDLMRLEVL